MEWRSIFKNIFGNNSNTKQPSTSTEIEIIDGRKAVFTRYNGDFVNDPDVITCVDTIARNAAKMHPVHLSDFAGKKRREQDKISNYVAKKPNELQNAYKFYYQVVSNLFFYNDSIIYVQRDENYKLTGLYPLDFSEGKFYEYQGKIWVKFKFGRKKERFVPYSDCIHLTRFNDLDGLVGGSQRPLVKVLSFKHVLDEGIINAIKTTQSIRGILKSTKSILKPEDVKKMRDQFVTDFMDADNTTGIGGLDATTTFDPVELKPTVATAEQAKSIDNKILSYFGLNENIIQSKYNEDEWNAFYESVLEPIGIQMSLEFTDKIFTPTEKNYGHEIIFESNRLQYASNKTKIEILRYGGNIFYVDELREVFNMAPLPDGEGQKILIDQNHQQNNNIDDSNDENEEGDEENEGEGN